MALPETLPHLFGRFTAVMRDHANIGETLGLLRAMCAVLDSGQTVFPNELTPPDLTLRFYEELSAHFATEETEAYFGTVVDEEPCLEPKIAALKADHLSMLHSADMVCKMATDSSRWPDMSRPIRTLMEQLERHERAESALLRELFHSAPSCSTTTPSTSR